MPVYNVLEPPLSRRGTGNSIHRFAFIREGFSLAAFLFGPLWMIRWRLWLVLLLYVLIVGGIEYGFVRLGIVGPVRLAVYLLIQLLVALEAAVLRRNALLGRRWHDCGVVIADDLELAERRFFDAREKARQAAARPLASPGPAFAASPPRSAVGLFPEPGGRL